MKKLNQLFLLITSVVSVTLLLIYRHEYNRLRYVLEVFNFFGQPSECNYPDFLNTTTASHDWGPIPVWQTLDSSYVYSAFIHKSQVEALVVSDGSAMQNCYVWYEDKLKPVIGKLKYAKENQVKVSDVRALYKYYCSFDDSLGLPYAVSFSGKSKRTKDFKKILLHHANKKKFDYTVVCVLPSETYTKATFLEFISFYKILGVDTFIVYNNNIPHHTMRLLQNLSKKLGIRLTNYPWNYPGSEDDNIRGIIEQDCLLRTNRESKNVIVLDSSEYIVPRYHQTLPIMLNHYDPKNHTQRFTLKSFTFCVANDNYREPSILHNLYYDTSKPEETLMVYRVEPVDKQAINTQEIMPGIATVHRYVKCTPHAAHNKRDDSILRFKSDLLLSTLVKVEMYSNL